MSTKLGIRFLDPLLMASTILVIGMFLVTACKKKDASESENRSLDNFTSDRNKVGFQLNSCTKDQAQSVYTETYNVDGKTIRLSDEISKWVNKDHIIIEGKSLPQFQVFEKTLNDLFSIIPLSFWLPFFEKGGQILLTEGAPVGCKEVQKINHAENDDKQSGGAYKDVEELDSLSCFYFESSKNPVPRVAIGSGKIAGKDVSTEQMLKHSLLRTFALYSTVFLDQEFALKSSASVQQTINQTRQLRSQLAEALMRDVKINEMSDIKRMEAMKAGTHPDFFAAQAMAEAMDSYFCSKRSHAIFSACFPESYAMMTGKEAVKFDKNECTSFFK